ncbi:helix-turn-helix domain-containing protein [Nocardia tengchongensis]
MWSSFSGASRPLMYPASDTRWSDTLRPPTFGEFLRHLRDERCLSRERLAMHSGLSASYINHLECGRRDRPTQIVVQALLACLHRISPVPDESRNHLFVLAGLRSYTTSNTRAHQDGGVGSI